MARLLLAMANSVTREGLKQLITPNRDIEIGAQVDNARELYEVLSKNDYDLLFLDTSLSGSNWLDLLRQLKQQKPKLAILLLSTRSDENESVLAFNAGASGYLATDCSPDELSDAIRKIMNGERYVSPSISERLAFGLKNGSVKPLHELLSGREYQVMRLLASGKTISEIAKEMFLSVKTISTYRSRLLEKLNLKTNVELALYYDRRIDVKNSAGLSPYSSPISHTDVSRPSFVWFRNHKWVAVTFMLVVIVIGLMVWWMRLAREPDLSGTFGTPLPPSASVSSPVPTPKLPLPAADAFMKGFNFADWKPFDAPTPKWGLYSSPWADKSLRDLAATGANWISLVVNIGQETVGSITVFHSQPRTATDSELQRIIDMAHSLGMRVMLLPYLELSNDPTHSHSQIGMAFYTETQWQDWFASYREVINYYATFSQEAGVDMLAIGNQLGGTTQRQDDWRRVIKGVRQRFKGPLTYSPLSNGEESRIEWWDGLDYIGWEPFYPLTDKTDPTVADLKAAWIDKGYLAIAERLSEQFNRPVIIMKLGYASRDGTNEKPGDYNRSAPVDLQEQADCYEAALEVLWGKPWLKGIFWWQWFANPEIWPGGPSDTSYTPSLKPAQDVLTKFYAEQR